MWESTGITTTSDLPLHIARLEGPEGLQVWQREMREFLTAELLIKYTKIEQKDRPVVPIIASDTPPDELERLRALIAAAEDKVSKWELGHELTANIIRSRLGNYLFYDFKDLTNAHLLWNAVIAGNKPKGVDTSNTSSERQESSYAFVAPRPKDPAASESIIIIDPQKGAVAGPHSQMVQQLVKYCRYCKKYYHTETECNRLDNNASRQKNNGDRGLSNNNYRNDDKFKDKLKDKVKDRHRRKCRRHNSASSSDTEI